MKISLELQPCFGQRSGIGLYTYELAKRLNINSDISLLGNVFNFAHHNNNLQALQDIRFPIKTAAFLPYGIYRRAWHLLPLSYDNFFGSSDLSHFFNFIVPPKITGKVLNTIYDLTYMYYPETMDLKNFKRITKDINYSIARSDLLITISESTRADLLKTYSLSPDRVKVIYPSSSLSENSICKTVLSSKYNITTPYILYVGNLEPRKNIERLVHAYYKLKKENLIPNQLVIAGGKSWSYLTIFEAVRKLNLQDSIIFTGYVSEEEKVSLYENAALFVYPSLYEGFGMPVLEALTCNTPVVCSNASSMPEVGGDAAYYINPLDVNDLADGIYKMLTYEKLRKEKMSFAQAQVSNFSWDKSASALMEIYKSFF